MTTRPKPSYTTSSANACSPAGGPHHGGWRRPLQPHRIPRRNRLALDNSFIAWGLRRYGFKDEAAVVAAGILEAAEFFDGRLPEAFGGYPRAMTKYPVQYPTACTPQAW